MISKAVIEEINKCLRMSGKYGLQNVIYGLYNDHVELQEMKAAQQSGQTKSCRLETDPIHYGPFVHTPEGKAKCTNCGETL